MKKLLPLIIVSLCIASTLSAQIGKGSILLGGNLGFTSTTSGSDKNEGFLISPSLGMAVAENLIAGVNVRYVFSESSGSASETRNYGAGFFLRKYKHLGKGFYLFGEGELGFDRFREKQRVVNNQIPDVVISRTNAFRLGLAPGISYALTKRLQLELMFTDLLSVSYSTTKREYERSRACWVQNPKHLLPIRVLHLMALIRLVLVSGFLSINRGKGFIDLA